jgi:hypothetical protein
LTGDSGTCPPPRVILIEWTCRQIKALDKSLQGFINAMRPIGSSDDLISSASSLRTRLVDLHSGFRRNAARLFPELERLDAIKETPWRGAHPLSRHRANPSSDAVMTPTILGNLLNKCAQELMWLLQVFTVIHSPKCDHVTIPSYIASSSTSFRSSLMRS